jgi:hypothetical protein
MTSTNYTYRNVVKNMNAEYAAEQETFEPDMIEWIKKNGSPYLKKAVAAGIALNALGKYYQERLCMEGFGIEWKLAREEDLNLMRLIRNPPESEIDILIEEQKKHGNDVSLSLMENGPGIYYSALTMKCPWNNKRIMKLIVNSCPRKPSE